MLPHPINPIRAMPLPFRLPLCVRAGGILLMEDIVTRIHRVGLALWLLLVQSIALAAPLHIHYLVRPIPPAGETAGALRVMIHVSGAKGMESMRFQMPVWSPGDYHVQNHGKAVRD